MPLSILNGKGNAKSGHVRPEIRNAGMEKNIRNINDIKMFLKKVDIIMPNINLGKPLAKSLRYHSRMGFMSTR